MEIDNILNCEIYVFNKLLNIIYPMDCLKYDEDQHKIINPNHMLKLTKLNIENIKKNNYVST